MHSSLQRTLSVGLAGALAVGLSAPLVGQTPDAAQVLASAREAIGGEKKLSAIRTFTITGRTRQVRGNNLVPIEFEIDCELPDKFVRKDEIPASDTDPTTVGFVGDQLIQAPAPSAAPPGGRGPGAAPAASGRSAAAAPPGGRSGGPGAGRGGPPGLPRLVVVKQDFARLTLGMFVASFSAYPLTFKYAALGEAPEGKADILDVAGPNNFQARFVVQRDTHLPVMLMWQQPAPGQPNPVEYRMYYADFRDVDGLKLPFRIRRAVAGDTVEEMTIDRIKLNPKIDPRRFEISK